MTDPTPKPRWYRLTPGRLLPVLLAVEGFLWLAERYQWFAFNQHKGWTVLVAVASLGVFFLVTLGWFLVALVFRWRFQFSILSLLVLFVAVALPCGWLATEREQAGKQRVAADWIEEAGGTVDYDYQCYPPGRVTPRKPPGLAWLRKLLGDDHFADVTRVVLSGQGVSDAGVEHLKGLTQLQELWLDDTKVSDAGLEYLKGMTQLQGL